MSNIAGTFTPFSTGTLTINTLGFDPNDLEFTVRARNGASGNIVVCTGTVDSAGNDFCTTAYIDGSNRTQNDFAKCFVVWEYSGGWSQVLVADFNSYVTGGFSLNVTTANSNYQVLVKARTT